ncbi:MAG: YcxB family protein [Bacillota bacterium]|jgi:hypothetical protein
METKDKHNAAVIEAKIQLTPKDKERAIDYNYFVKRKLILADVVFFLLLAVALIALKYTGLAPIPAVLVYLSYGVIVLLVVFFMFIKMMASVGGVSPTRYVTISEEALTTRVANEKKEFTIRWEDFPHKAATKNYFFLYPDATQFLILPKRCFSPEEVKTITGYIKR